ncbi:MAG: hypothetical protein ACOVO1_02030 [Chitinophagaceae bacterium]
MNTNKIDSIIDSLNSIKQAEVTCFFETRLNARMKIELVASHPLIFIFKKPAYIMAVLLLLLCVNIYLLSSKPVEKNISKIENHQSNTIDAFNNDYQLINNTHINFMNTTSKNKLISTLVILLLIINTGAVVFLLF